MLTTYPIYSTSSQMAQEGAVSPTFFTLTQQVSSGPRRHYERASLTEMPDHYRMLAALNLSIPEWALLSPEQQASSIVYLQRLKYPYPMPAASFIPVSLWERAAQRAEQEARNVM